MKEIILYSGERCQVSDEDYTFVNQWTWYLTTNGYTHRTDFFNGQSFDIQLHLLVAERANIDSFPTIDHKDTNKLNCQRENLRTATKKDQQGNRGCNQNNKIGYRGVRYKKSHKKFEATFNRKFIGMFKTAEEAALSWNEEAKAYYGDFAKLNEIKHA